MKFLEYTPFDSINLFLEQLNLGDCTMRVNLEAFSCKHTATDRRLSISLEHEVYAFPGPMNYNIITEIVFLPTKL
ncbi:hypothetical protein BDA96_08G150800 [Sorghum bicolor]|uniref:Uncharacterized protein n=1 Tax=Sorghum bicolor TaxID=4558 RepID=A0A921QGH1_SORBI|nr:hypothetical protein BDA96_08G150800 [Sorghum bicolor]